MAFIVRKQVPLEQEIADEYNRLNEELLPEIMSALSIAGYFGRRSEKLPVRTKKVKI